MEKRIRWGIIGCGDVTEIKSGPAFNKVPDSVLVAVMRRNAALAEDYARRHKVPKWYDDAAELIADPEVNAVYIATPPASHEAYALAALQAGKPVYVEKPMTADAAAAGRLADAAESSGIPVTIAHYRRGQLVFRRIRELLTEGVIGEVRLAELRFHQALPSKEKLEDPRFRWRVDPSISGGGLFHDLAPHQLDLMLYFFGTPSRVSGIALNRAGAYEADDTVSGEVLFANSVLFHGSWCFCVPEDLEEDICVITGSRGSISFSVFGEPVITLLRDGKKEDIRFDRLDHVQQPMIADVVQYFLGRRPNPCTPRDGQAVMEMIETMTAASAVR